MIRRSASFIFAFFFAFAPTANGWSGFSGSRRYSGKPIARSGAVVLPFDAGVPDPVVAFFAFPESGTGTTTACSTTPPTARFDGGVMILTATRSTVAECPSVDGQTYTQLAANVLRVTSGAVNVTSLGGFVEPLAATNDLLYGRAPSNAVWTKTNMTCTQVATGMRADVNGASHCVATAANATVCQTIITAAAVRNTSGHIKRSIGTGAITIARDATTYGANFSSQLSAARWKRAVSYDAAGCAGGDCIVQQTLTSSVLNPQICLKIATSGDAVDLDFWQDEAGAKPTSPIETLGTAVPRGAEVAYFTTTPFIPACMAVSFQTVGLPGAFNSPMGAYQDATNQLQAWLDTNNVMNCINYHAAVLDIYGTTFFAPISASTWTQWACEFGATTVGKQRGVPYSQAGSAALPTVTRIYVGSGAIAGASGIAGVFKNVFADPVASVCAARQTFDSTGSPILANGDSITFGLAQLPTRWAQGLDLLQNRAVFNLGLTGISASVCLDNFRLYGVGHGYASQTLLCGINDLAAGASAVDTFAPLQTLYDEAAAAGIRVTPATITPWAGYALSSPAKQVETLALNALIAGYASTHGLTLVDLFNSALNDGAGALAAAYDSGDHIHPNAAGGVLMAPLWNAANP